jgi:hypothetical protein
MKSFSLNGYDSSDEESNEYMVLDSRYNNISDDGARALAEALRNARVTTLDLGYNIIGAAGAEAFAAALMGTHVTTLDLGIKKSDLCLLLMEVNEGEYAGFQHYLNINNIHILDLTKDTIVLDLHHLGQALKNTAITKVIFNFMDVYDGDYVDEFSFYKPEDIEKLCLAIPETHLLEVENMNNEALQALLLQNQRKYLVTPYYIACAAQESADNETPKSKLEREALTEISSEDEKFSFACEIIGNLPVDIAQNVISFLPLMDVQRAANMRKRALEKYQPSQAEDAPKSPRPE